MNSRPHEPVSIGCPVWSCPAWKGSVYAQGAAKSKWLNQYSNLFNTVEGNSTFYGIPAPDTFRRWAAETSDGFEFCLKFPRVISHDAKLRGVQREMDQFLSGVAILHEASRLGPTFLQLGPDFSPQYFPVLKQFLDSLPGEFPFAVEVRHKGWFDSAAEGELVSLLQEKEIDRVIFDSRPLYSAPPTDEYEQQSQMRKPRIPLRQNAIAGRPMLRLIGRNDVSTVREYVDQWAPVIARWISEGRRPLIFAHTPDESFAPEFARMIRNALAEIVPGVQRLDDFPFSIAQQMELF